MAVGIAVTLHNLSCDSNLAFPFIFVL